MAESAISAVDVRRKFGEILDSVAMDEVNFVVELRARAAQSFDDAS